MSEAGCLKPILSPSIWLQADSRKVSLSLSPKGYTGAEIHFYNTAMGAKNCVFLVTATSYHGAILLILIFNKMLIFNCFLFFFFLQAFDIRTEELS